jgi:hypothetical protein
MQASLIALAAALLGIVLERFGQGTPYISLTGTALIMGAFVIAITSFLLFLRIQFFGRPDEIAWNVR